MTARSPVRTRRVRGCDRGSASLEIVALVPILILVGSLLLQLGVAIWTTVAADTAARSAARAATLHGDPLVAANSSLPGSLSVSPGDVDVSNVHDPDGVRITLTVSIPRVSVIPGALSVTRDAVMPEIEP